MRKKGKLERQKRAVKRMEILKLKYEDELKVLEKNTDSHKKITLKLKRLNIALDNTLKKY